MKQALLLLYFAVGLLFFRECACVTDSVQKSACYGNALNCSYMNLTCPHGLTGFILSAQYGFQPKNVGCPDAPVSNCTNDTCCAPLENACYKNFSSNDFHALYCQCWKHGCAKYQVPWSDSNCSDFSKSPSLFVLLQHACLASHHIIDMNENRSINGSLLAVLYNRSNHYNPYKKWQCRVTFSDALSSTVNIMVVKEPHTQHNANRKNCSNLGIDSEQSFSCNLTNVTYVILQKSSNFTISLYREQGDDFPYGCVLMQAQNGTNVTVTCGQYCDREEDSCLDTSSTTALEPSSTNPPTTQSLSLSTMESSAVTSQTSDADLTKITGQVSDTTTIPASPGSSAGAVAGGVVAALLVLVAAVVGVVFFVRRRRQKPEEAKAAVTGTSPGRLPMKSLQSSSSSGHRPPHPGTAGKREDLTSDLPAETCDYFQVEPESKVNGHVAEASEPDYDRLGGKKPQSSSSNPAATYGRLGEVGGGGEDTDYSYDHLARGRQAAPDVIDSDYDTSALHVTSEGDYNVAGIPKKQHVITGSDYDVAQVVTSEGDYNRMDFQGKKQHVITGSDYDTAEIVTSEGDYNKVDFQGKKHQVITGSDYDVATAVTSEYP